MHSGFPCPASNTLNMSSGSDGRTGPRHGSLQWACQLAADHRSFMVLLRVNEVTGMDPIALIVTALAAGAALGVQDTAAAMVKDAYASLKALVRRRLGGDPGAEMVLARHEQAPETWQAPLMAELARAGAVGGRCMIATPRALLGLVGDAGE